MFSILIYLLTIIKIIELIFKLAALMNNLHKHLKLGYKLKKKGERTYLNFLKIKQG